MKVSEIGFPGLGIGPFKIDSVAFTVFGIEIAWYAVIITFGMIMAVAYCSYRAKQIGLTVDDVIDFALAAIPIGVIGARLYYILSKLEDFDTFRDWIAIRDGGLAIYGGIIAGTLVAVSDGKIVVDEIPELIERGDRTKAGVTLPPHGLYLNRIWYASGEASEWIR